MKDKKKGLKLYHKIFIGLFLGIIVGIAFNYMGGADNPFIAAKVLPFLEFLGALFLKLIKMVVVPLVFFSIIEGVTSLQDVRKLRSIGVKTVLLILGSAMVAVSIGLLLANIIQPGAGFQLGQVEASTLREMPSGYQVVLDLFPSNPFIALVEGKMMQIITFAMFTGVALIMLGEKAEPLNTVISTIAQAMFKIVDMILNVIPYGVFGLMAVATTRFGLAIFGPISKFIFTDYLAAIIHTVVTYSFMLIFFAKVNPIKFWKKAFEPWMIAFSTCTTSAALPVSMKIAPKLGIPKQVSNFVLPLGATANMNGTCIYFGVIVLFAAQLYGIELSIAQQAMLALQATLLSVGCAAMPQVGLLISITLLTSMGLPLEATALIAGVYRIIDQIHTATNAGGDIVVAASVAGLEGTLNYDDFNADNMGKDLETVSA